MKYPYYLALITSLAALTGCDQLQSNNSGADNSATTSTVAETPAAEGIVIATVNGQPITRSELAVYSGQRKPPNNTPEANSEEVIMKELVSLELMRQESISKGLDKQPMVIATIEQQERTALAGAAIQDFLANSPITDDDAKKIYDEQMSKPTREFNARHILVKEQDEAVAIIDLLDKGGDFSELAKEKSTGPSGASGGELGWFNESQMVKPFSEAAAQLEKGQYTKTPVQTQFGWHVIILDDSRESTPVPFDDVKDRIKMLLANQNMQQHVEELRNAANIEIN
ncbi:peptidylprolyl isomerase [Gammaproteobacteria bacterium]|jgi:peptidyl-prolyl cis-trans isomerase C|nr:peptidylprolyl isomerase [Gammaproteobacteria bacterium]